MPNYDQCREAAQKIVDLMDRGTREDSRSFFAFLGKVLDFPQGYGLCPYWVRHEYPNYGGSPNWNLGVMAEFCCQILWGKKFHPNHPAVRGMRFGGAGGRFLAKLLVAGRGWDGHHSQQELEEFSRAKRGFYGDTDSLSAGLTRFFLRKRLPISADAILAHGQFCRPGVLAWAMRNDARLCKMISLGYGPDGRMIRVMPAAMLDEIFPEDLPQGEKSGLERVIRTAWERKGMSQMDRAIAANIDSPVLPWRDGMGSLSPVTVIRRAADLDTAASRMQNCSRGYWSRMMAGDLWIVTIGSPANCSSMAEITKNKAGRPSVVQHKSFHNSEPSAADKSALAKWLEGLR